MKRYGVKCSTIRVQIKGTDFKTVSKQRTIDTPTNLEKILREVSYELLCEVWNLRKPIRAITITGANLVTDDEGVQVSLFDEIKSDEKRENLEETIETVRKKFGFDSLKTADTLSTILIDE